MTEPTDLGRLFDATLGAAHTVTPNGDGTYSYSWSFPRQPVQFDGFDTVESEEALQAAIAIRASPLAILPHVAGLRPIGQPYDRLYMSPVVYHQLRQAWRRGWWRALPRRDKQWLRRHGLTP